MSGADIIHGLDVVVIGGGHAGIEAACAAARVGARVLLVSLDASAIGRMSCNPAIGGQAKGQMVCEIDALGGVMGLATDACGIQFRMLNRSQGPAVWGPRAQCDKARYARWTQEHLAHHPGIRVVEGSAERLITEPVSGPEQASCRVAGVVVLTGRAGSPAADRRPLEIRAASVIITTGTFLRGLMHTGEQKQHGGRVGEAAAVTLSDELTRLGLRLGRLKTGTPPRIRESTIDFSCLEEQPGDEPPQMFSFLNHGSSPQLPQRSCYLTATSEPVHELIRANLHRAPMYSGQIAGTGPRYCPSIEDKVVRFAQKTSHHIFLEPEGLDTDWWYCNGISTSLPADVQAGIVRQIRGLERAEIVQWGYAVEYDFVSPEQIGPDLQTRAIRGLFLAGQINGTSGYEEAAGQGLLAGVNAARWAAADGQEAAFRPFVLRRSDAYIGVMIDDLVTRPPTEPYRMFTSRAEYRLSLRADNADRRLGPIARAAGLLSDARWERLQHKLAQIEALLGWLAAARVGDRRAEDVLRQPGMDLSRLRTLVRPQDAESFPDHADAQARLAVQTDTVYSGYLARQEQQVARLAAMEERHIPPGLDYARVPGLRREVQDKLSTIRPLTLGQASRISGVNPTDLSILLLAIRRHAP
mgnify:CR=1 FL=1